MNKSVTPEPRLCRVYVGETCISECVVNCRRLLDLDIALEDDEDPWGIGSVREGILRFLREDR